MNRTPTILDPYGRKVSKPPSAIASMRIRLRWLWSSNAGRMVWLLLTLALVLVPYYTWLKDRAPYIGFKEYSINGQIGKTDIMVENHYKNVGKTTAHGVNVKSRLFVSPFYKAGWKEWNGIERSVGDVAAGMEFSGSIHHVPVELNRMMLTPTSDTERLWFHEVVTFAGQKEPLETCVVWKRTAMRFVTCSSADHP